MAQKRTAISDNVSSALAALNEIRQAALAGAPQVMPKGGSDGELAAGLRTALAVRGWINPRQLLPSDIDEMTRVRTLNAVAPDVETSFSRYPGKWYMSVPVRRSIIAARDRDALRAELDQMRHPDDDDDPVHLAFRALLDPGEVDLQGRSVDELRAIENAAEWLGNKRTDVATIQDRAAALAAERQRDAEVARLSNIRLIGREHAVSTLVQFLTAPAQSQSGLSTTYLYGVGGAGKSTVLAHVEQRVSRDPDGPMVIHLDFDRVDLDPSDPVTLDLVLLQQLSVALPEAAANCRQLAKQLEDYHRRLQAEKAESVTDRRQKSRKGARRRRVAKADTAGHSEALEAVSTAGGSERESIVYRKFAAGGSDAIALPARPLALICDTLETVFARGETTTYDFGEWLEGLVRIFGATDVRAVLAGRDPLGADSRVNICAFLGGRGHRVAPDIRLEDLAPDDAKELLLDAGIDDETVARAAAMALPGNPLVLRVAGEVFSNAPAALLDEIRREYHAGRIDRETASRYLTQRVVIHVPDQVAQRYVLAAMVLPEVTEKLIREIVIPVVDGESIAQRTSGLAKRVYAALSQASWLVKPSFDGMSFTFHPALRTLVLKLMDADAKLSDLRGRVRAAAIVWHRGKRTPKDRAFALYHRLMRGDQIGPDVGDLAQLLAPLPVPFLDDLPEPRRKALTESGVDIGGTGQTATRETDNEWKAYVEGLGERDGQGDKLVKSGRAEQALALYRERPTREPGVPPTFFIQALADHAEWDTDEVDRDRVLAEVESACRASGERISGVMLSRIYWLTRYELLRRPRRLEPEHMRVLRLVAERVSPSGRFLVMPSLIALAEAFARQRVAPPTWIGTKGSIQSETRLFLVHALYADKPFTAKPNLDALIVTQRDWARCVRSVAGSIIGSVQKRKPDLDAAQRQISALHRAPFSEVGRTMRELRQPLELNFSEIDPEAAILLLRGATVEFNRPLTSALTACAKEANQGLRREPVWRALGATLSRMSILPREFHDDFLRELVASNPREWFGSTVSFIDRSRLLPELCLRVVKLVPTDTPARRRLVRIAKTFLKWESALCDGGSSVWRPE